LLFLTMLSCLRCGTGNLKEGRSLSMHLTRYCRGPSLLFHAQRGTLAKKCSHELMLSGSCPSTYQQQIRNFNSLMVDDSVPMINTLLGAALEIFLLEKKWVPRTQKNRNKKNEQAKPTEQLWTTPKSLIFDFTMAAKMLAGVHITRCYHHVLPALATLLHACIARACDYIAKAGSWLFVAITKSAPNH
jgi:hypothetical protein